MKDAQGEEHDGARVAFGDATPVCVISIEPANAATAHHTHTLQDHGDDKRNSTVHRHPGLARRL